MSAALVRLRSAQILFLAAIALAVVSAYVVMTNVFVLRRDYQAYPNTDSQLFSGHVEMREFTPIYERFEEVR